MDPIVDRLLSLVNKEWSAHKNVEARIKFLKGKSKQVEKKLRKAENDRNAEDRFSIHQLKSIYLDIENLIDEYETACRLRKARQTRKRKWLEIWLPTNNHNLTWSESRRIDGEIQKIKERWDDILNEEEESKHNEDTNPFEDVPWIDHEDILGREDERAEIVTLLLSDLGQSSKLRRTIPVIPIYGAAGVGKTTLAQMVYEDRRIDGYFSIKAWVALTDRCDERVALKKIYKCLTKQDGSPDLDQLSRDLKEYFKGRANKRFLLVIDNLWANSSKFWDTLREPLLAGGEGSKVLITTRNKNTCHIMHALPRSSLSGLKDEECWQLIQSGSFPHGINDHANERFVLIGKEIAKRCEGSPMAAKIFGLLLHGKSEEDWRNKLSDMRTLNEGDNRVFARLMVSYYHLPYQEKRCFAYCCIFPNGYMFEKDQLIRYWMAEGLIQPDNNGQYQPEKVGGDYFDDLVSRSFFENITTCQSQIRWYRIPTLMCDLAKVVSEFELRDLRSDCDPPLYNFDEARYACLSHQQGSPHATIDHIESYSNLRTFKLAAEHGDHVVPLKPIQQHFFSKFTHMRVLDLSCSNIRDLPESVGSLRHLRYLGLSNTEIGTIPKELCNLINLETIELKRCSRLERLPDGMDKLIYLRHLDLHLDWEKVNESTEVVIPHGIGKLKQLQTLSRFNVTSSADGTQSNISVLENLKLRGNLCISNLERVPMSNPEDAKNANLQGKCIEHLLLRWSDFARKDFGQWQYAKSVITSLEPSREIKSLWLINYPSCNFPDWMGAKSFSNLSTVRISNSINFDFLKLLAGLPQLKDLQIDGIPSGQIDDFEGFNSLEHLTLSNLPFLQSVCLTTDLPKLKDAHVSNCDSLRRLLIHQKMQGKFIAENCPLLEICVDS